MQLVFLQKQNAPRRRSCLIISFERLQLASSYFLVQVPDNCGGGDRSHIFFKLVVVKNVKRK